jgi:hypothetical protein
MKIEISIAGQKQTIEVNDAAVSGSVTIPFTITPVVVAPQPTPMPTPTPIPQPVDSLNLLAFGAVANGTTDNQSAFDRAIAAARSQRKKLYIPAGKYAKSNVLNIDSVEVYGDGDASEIISTNPMRSAIFLKGSGSTLRSLSHTTSTTGIQRQSSAEQASIVVWMTPAFSIDDVTVNGGASIGMLMYGSSNGIVRKCRVYNTLADSYHMTYGSKNIGILNNVARNCGDDGVAVVSYGSNPTMCSDISIIGNDVGHNYWGRGIAVSGGRNITIQGNTIAKTNAAGILISSEGTPWNTYEVDGVVCKNNNVLDCVTSATIGHPAVLVHGRSGYFVRNVTFESVVVSNPRNDGFRFDPYLANIVVRGGVVTGVKPGFKAFNINPSWSSSVSIV